ncbi:reverse transcriptase domain-containing protein [Tanacetum coccineum]
MNLANIKAQAQNIVEYDVKRTKMLNEYNDYINQRADELSITKISYRVNSSKEATKRITGANDPLNVTVHERNMVPPPGVEGRKGLVIREPESGIFFYNGNFDLVFQREEEFHLATAAQLIRLYNSIQRGSLEAEEMFTKLELTIKAKEDVAKSRIIKQKHGWLERGARQRKETIVKRWVELQTAFISRFFPPALFDQLLGEIRAFSQHENESLTNAWLRMKEMLRNCHGHNLSKGNIIKIFYHSLNEITQEVLNATAGGIFLYKTPNQAYQLLEDKVLLKLDWAKNQKTKSSLKKTVAFADEGSSNSDTDKIMARMDAMTIKMDAQYKELQSRTKQPTPNLDDDDIPMSCEEEAKFMQTFCKTRFYNDYRDRDSNRDNWCSSGRNDYNRDNYRSNTDDKSYDLQRQFNDFMKSQQSTNAFVKETFMDLKTQLETVAKNHQASIQNLETKFDRFADKQSGRPSGSLTSNTQPNPRVGKFTFPADFVILEIEEDSKVPLILGRPFLHTTDAAIQVKQKQLNLGVGTERMIFNIDSAIKNSYSNNDTCFSIDVIDEILEEDFDALLDEGSKILYSIKGTVLEEEIFSEFDKFIAMAENENY